MKKLTVTIGIPAYNEDGGIVNLIDNLLQQEQQNFVLEKIIINDDGSTDNTVKYIQKHRQFNKNVLLISDGKRMGQAARLNQLLSKNKSDVFVTIDADSIPKDNFMLKYIVDEFIKDPTLGLVAGNDQPLRPKNFFGNVVATGIDLWYETRKDINNGDSVQNCHGCILSFSKRLAINISIPTNIFGFDEYIYFANKKFGYGFKVATKSVVFYKIADNIKDFLKQNSRYLQTEKLMNEYFKSDVYINQKPSLRDKFQATLRMLFRSPIFLMLAIFLQLFLRVFKPFYVENTGTGIWTVIGKSK